MSCSWAQQIKIKIKWCHSEFPLRENVVTMRILMQTKSRISNDNNTYKPQKREKKNVEKRKDVITGNGK